MQKLKILLILLIAITHCGCARRQIDIYSVEETTKMLEFNKQNKRSPLKHDYVAKLTGDERLALHIVNTLWHHPADWAWKIAITRDYIVLLSAIERRLSVNDVVDDSVLLEIVSLLDEVSRCRSRDWIKSPLVAIMTNRIAIMRHPELRQLAFKEWIDIFTAEPPYVKPP
jgi:hypothetical protein